MGIKKISQWGRGPCPSLHCPTAPPTENSVYFFALPSMNGPLPAELKSGENPERMKKLHTAGLDDTAIHIKI